MLLTLEHLEHMDVDRCSCGDPDCRDKGFTVSPACHEGAPVYVKYARGSGRIQLHCAVCREGVVEVAVALATA